MIDNKLDGNDSRPVVRRNFPIGRGILINLLFGFVIYHVVYLLWQSLEIAIIASFVGGYLTSGFIFYDVELFRKKLIYRYPTRLFYRKKVYDEIDIDHVRYTDGGPRDTPYFIVNFKSSEKRYNRTISIDSSKQKDQIIRTLESSGIEVIEV